MDLRALPQLSILALFLATGLSAQAAPQAPPAPPQSPVQAAEEDLRRKVRVVHHGGTANGAMSFFVLFPETGMVVSMNANLLFAPFEDFSNEAIHIADLFLQADRGTK
jgi:hypothetical protein